MNIKIRGIETEIECDEKVYFADEEIMYHQVLKDSQEAITNDDLEKLEAFYTKYKAYADAIEVIILQDQKEFEENGPSLEIENKIDMENMTHKEVIQHCKEQLEEIPTAGKIYRTIRSTVNTYMCFTGRPMLGETQEEFDEWGEYNED